MTDYTALLQEADLWIGPLKDVPDEEVVGTPMSTFRRLAAALREAVAARDEAQLRHKGAKELSIQLVDEVRSEAAEREAALLETMKAVHVRLTDLAPIEFAEQRWALELSFTNPSAAAQAIHERLEAADEMAEAVEHWKSGNYVKGELFETHTRYRRAAGKEKQDA